jgi:hypothetical protein
MPSGGPVSEEMMNVANMVGGYALMIMTFHEQPGVFCATEAFDMSRCSAYCGWQVKLEGVYHQCLSAKFDVSWDPEVFAGLTIKVQFILETRFIFLT